MKAASPTKVNRRCRAHTRDQHGAEPVGGVPEPGDDQQDAEDFRDIAGSIRQVADQQQVNAEEDQTDVPDGVVRVDGAHRPAGSPSSPSARTSWMIATR